MMMVALLGIVACSCIACCCSSVVVSANESGSGPDALKFDGYWDLMNSIGLPDGLLGESGGGDDGSNETSPQSSSSPPSSSGGTPSGTKDCVKYAKEKCDGKKGKSRDSCISEYKKSCVEDGGEWKPEKKDDKKKDDKKKDDKKKDDKKMDKSFFLPWKGKDCVKYAKDKCKKENGKNRDTCIGKYKSRCVEKGGEWKGTSKSSTSSSTSSKFNWGVDTSSKFNWGVGSPPKQVCVVTAGRGGRKNRVCRDV